MRSAISLIASALSGSIPAHGDTQNRVGGGLLLDETVNRLFDPTIGDEASPRTAERRVVLHGIELCLGTLFAQFIHIDKCANWARPVMFSRNPDAPVVLGGGSPR